MINKKIFFLVIGFLLISPLFFSKSYGASPTTASVDSSASAVGTVLINSLGVTLSTNTPRDLILLQVSMANNTGQSGCVITTVSDTATLVWTKLGNASETFHRLEVWWAISTSSSVLSGDVITATIANSAKCTMGLVATGIAGSLLSTPFDDGFVSNSGNSLSPSVNINVVFQNDLIVGFSQDLSSTLTANAGFVIYQTGSASGSETLKIQAMYLALATANTIYTAGGTLSGSNHWLIGAVAIQSVNQIASSNISSATISFFILYVVLSLFLDFIPFLISKLGYGGLIIELISGVFGVYFYLAMQESNGEFNQVFVSYPSAILIPMLLAMFSFILFIGLAFRKFRF